MYSHVLQYVYSAVWAIRPEMALVIKDLLTMRAAGHRLTPAEIHARIDGAATSDRATPRTAPGVAVIPIVGVLSQRMELLKDVSSSGMSPDMVGRNIQRAVNDPSVAAIVLDIDSPGGTVYGLQELGDQIRAARNIKPIVAVANSVAASAAYWIGSQAQEFVVTPSGQVGSIGVLAMHENIQQALKNAGVEVNLLHYGKYKIEGNSFEPLGTEARAQLQSDINAYGSMFTRAVARGRNVSVDKVRSEFGQGRMVMAADAARRGMVDGVETLDSVISRLGRPAHRASTAARMAGDGYVAEQHVRVRDIRMRTVLAKNRLGGCPPPRGPISEPHAAIQMRARVARAQSKEHGVP